MNIYGSLMDIFDEKNKDIFDQKTKKRIACYRKNAISRASA